MTIKSLAAALPTEKNVKFVVELRCSNGSALPRYAYWGSPAKIYVRAYSGDKKVFEHYVAGVDKRYQGPRSRCGKLLAYAEGMAHVLQTEYNEMYG